MNSRLFFGLLLNLPLVWTANAADLSAQQQQAKEIYKQLVEINTTHSVGDTTLAAQAMADRLIAAGLPKKELAR